MKLIKLDYAVLSILVNNSISGYDITSSLQEIWKTTHSRVYPVLAKLEKLELVKCRHQEQFNKPNKKIYTITDKGIEVIKHWLKNITPSSSIKKDEGILKIMCMHLLDKDSQRKIISNRLKRIQKEKEHLDHVLPKIKAQLDNKATNEGDNDFSLHIINEASNAFLGLEMLFTEWVLHLLDQDNISEYSNYKFSDYIREKFSNK